MPTTIRLTSDGPAGAIVDAFEQSLLVDWPEPERTRITSDLRAIQALGDDAAAAAKAAEESKKFTSLGLGPEVKRALTPADDALKPHESHAAKRTAEATATRTKAHQPPTAPAEADVKWHRENLKGLDPLEVLPMYLSAIERADWSFIVAVEDAPLAIKRDAAGHVQQYALLTPEMREQGDAMKLLRSPLAAQLLQEEAVAEMYRSVVGAVRTQLLKLAERHGLSLSDLE